MADIKWGEPPAVARPARTLELDQLADELRAYRGRWALVETNPYPGSGKVYKARGLEAVTRTRREGHRTLYDVYARAPE